MQSQAALGDRPCSPSQRGEGRLCAPSPWASDPCYTIIPFHWKTQPSTFVPDVDTRKAPARRHSWASPVPVQACSGHTRQPPAGTNHACSAQLTQALGPSLAAAVSTHRDPPQHTWAGDAQSCTPLCALRDLGPRKGCTLCSQLQSTFCPETCSPMPTWSRDPGHCGFPQGLQGMGPRALWLSVHRTGHSHTCCSPAYMQEKVLPTLLSNEAPVCRQLCAQHCTCLRASQERTSTG